MAVELGGISVHNLTDVSVRERTRLVRHPVPGMAGDVTQVLGRPCVEVSFAGACYGPDAADQVQKLRDAQLAGEPLDFFAEAVGESFVAQVVVETLEVAQRAGHLDEFGFRCRVVEYIEPPEPPEAGLLGTELGDFGDLDSLLDTEALGFVDDLQNALDQVAGLTDLLTAVPDFGDPTARLGETLDSFTGAAGEAPELLGTLSDGVAGQLSGGLPGADELASANAGAATQAGTFVEAVRGLAPDNPDSPLAGVAGALSGIEQRADVDVSGITEQLPAALERVDGVLRPANIEFVESIGEAYQTVRQTLDEHPLLAQSGGAGVLESVLGILSDVSGGFSTNLGAGVAEILDLDDVATLTEALAAIEQLRTSFPDHVDDLLPFLAQNLVGLPAGLLDDLRTHLSGALEIAVTAQSINLQPQLQAPLTALANAYLAVVSALDGFDPADAAAYAGLRAALDALGTAAGTAVSAVTVVYNAFGTAVDSFDWQAVLSIQPLLDAAADATAGVLTFDDLSNEITTVLEGVAAGVERLFDTDEVTRRGMVFADAVNQVVDSSPLMLVRDVLAEFVGKLRELIDQIPLEDVEAAIDDLLTQAKGAIDDLGIDDIVTSIEQAFAELDTFVQEQLDEDLVDGVRTALEGLGAHTPTLPVKDVLAKLGYVANQAGELVTSLSEGAAAQLDQLDALVGSLEELRFTPVTDEIVVELGDVRDRLKAMGAESLSDVERLAIQGALATLRALNVRGEVVVGLTAGYDELDALVRQALLAIRGVLDDLMTVLRQLDPTALLQPLRAALDEATEAVGSASARALLAPLREQADAVAESLEALRPGRLLEPLQGTYDQLRAAAELLDPQRWLGPLSEVWSQVEGVLDLLDIRPALEALDAKQHELLGQARQAILDALDDLNLPEPLATFVAGLRPAIEAMTDAVLGDPDTQLPEVLLYQPVREQVNALLRPLDEVYQLVVDLVAELPEDAVVGAMNALRLGVGALDDADPSRLLARFVQARDAFTATTPDVLLNAVVSLPSLHQRFELQAGSAPAERQQDVEATRAAFVSVEAGIDLEAPRQLHAEIGARFSVRVAGLDPAPVAESYARLRAGLERLVPEFLRGAEPLDLPAILAGLVSLRPSSRTQHLDVAIGRLVSGVSRVRAGLDPVVARLFEAVRKALGQISPLVVKAALDELYTALHEKLAILDPGAIIPRLRTELFQPFLDVFDAVDPAQLASRVDASYTAAVETLAARVDEILDALAGVLDQPLRQLVEDVQALIAELQATVTAAGNALETVVDRLERLDLVVLIDRLSIVLDNLRTSFALELERVANAFDDMLDAIPVGGEVSASASF
ncbi:hypothetical protein [Flindersiella endophytica]